MLTATAVALLRPGGGGLRWKQYAPGAVSTKYVAFTHDPTNNYNYTWWKETHPTWILYRCDRKTPAFKCFPPAPCDPPLPLDITNPDVVQFQMDNGVLPAKKEGYKGIAWDNFNLEDSIRACGHFDEAGEWVAMYNGTNETIFPDGRAQYEKDVIEWTNAIRAKSHAVGMLMIPNYQPSVSCKIKDGGYICTGGWNSSSVFAVGNGTDGALDECGFTGCSSGLTLGTQWENKLKFALNQQRHGRSYYSINEWGKWSGHWGPSSHHSPDIPLAVHAWVRWLCCTVVHTNVELSHTNAIMRCISGAEQLFDVQSQRKRDNLGLHAVLRVRWLELFMVAGGRNRCWPSTRAAYTQQRQRCVVSKLRKGLSLLQPWNRRRER